jgi:transcriptional regulator with XRE-family HTH domain
MASRSMIGDHRWMKPVEVTVIEAARRAAGLSQRRLARIAKTQQSSISEYETRRKSPTLEVVERLVDAAGFELAVRALVDFDYRDDAEVATFAVPDRLWSLPVPDCFARVQVMGPIFRIDEDRIWDLSDPAQRIEYYELVLVHGSHTMIRDSVDGVLLVQAWPHMRLPDVVRVAWQPAIEAASAPQDVEPRDPGGLSAEVADAAGIAWPPTSGRKCRRRRHSPGP